MRRPWILLLYSCFVSAGFAQPERLIMRTYTTVDGLPSDRVTDIVQDSAGVIWAATDRGVVGSDHERFIVEGEFRYRFIPPGPLRLARSHSDNGFLVAGRGAAFEVSHTRTPYWDGHELRSIFPEWDGDTAAEVHFTAVVESPDGVVTVGTADGRLLMRTVRERHRNRDAWLYQGATLDRVPMAEAVTCLEVGVGMTWVGSDRGLFRLVDRSVSRVEWPVLRSTSVTRFSKGPDGTLWVATTSGVYDVTANNARLLEGTRSLHATDVAVAANGDVWVGTFGKGLWRFRGNKRMLIGAKDGLASDRVGALEFDRDGNLWVGTDRGLTKIPPWSYRHYEAGRELPAGDWHAGIEARDGRVWFGGTGELVRIDGLGHRSWTAPVGMRRMAFRQLVEDSSGVMWALVDGGVVSFDGQSFRFVADDSAEVERRHGSVLMYHPQWGIVIVRPTQVRRLRGARFETVAMNPMLRHVSDAAFDGHGLLWLGSWSGVAAISPDGAVTPIPFLGSCIRLLPAGGGAVAIVDQQRGIVLSTEVLDVGTGRAVWSDQHAEAGGVEVTDGFVLSDGRRFVIRGGSIVRDQGRLESARLPVPSIENRILSFVYARRDGSVLLMQTWGDGNSFAAYDPTTGIVRPLPLLQATFSPNLSIDDFALLGTGLGAHVRRIFEDAAGTLWCVTRAGVFALPEKMGGSPGHAPKILSVTAGEERLLPGLVTTLGIVSTVQVWWRNRDRGVLGGFLDSLRFTLRAEDNDLQFEAAAGTHQEELGTLYQAMLEGSDPSWSRPQTSNRFVYRNVPQGSYRFRVRTMTADGAVSPERTVFVSLILPFWKTSWFGIIATLTVLYITLQFAARRIRRMREEHTRLTRQAVQENELRMARAVQMGMLPERCPEVPGCEIAARSLPATEVGGDFYDFIQDGSRTGIAVGDVSGHGITGAMIVGMARTSLRFASSRFERPSRVLTLANERLRQDISRNVFIAMFYGLLDPKKRLLQYICAGQPTPILVRDGKATFVPHGKGDRFPLGIVPRVSYREERLTLRAGDTVIIYTDGFVEAMNGSREEFGFERFTRSLERHAGRAAKDLIDAVVADVAAHASGMPQEDDMTMVILRFGKEGRS